MLFPVGEAGAKGIAGERGRLDAGSGLKILEVLGVVHVEAESEVASFCRAHAANIPHKIAQCQQNLVAFIVGNANNANMSTAKPPKKRRITIEVDERLQRELEEANLGTGLGYPEMGRVGLIKVIREWRATGGVMVQALPNAATAA